MGKKAVRKLLETSPITQAQSSDLPVDCACVIHGSYYDFSYVDKLYNGLCRNLSRPVTLHVYTEESREVPSPYKKHVLKNLGVEGPRKSWWYKTQLFDTKHHLGQLLYFDLDVVIVNNIDFILELSTDYFWGVRDFRYLFNPSRQSLNSSIMYFDTNRFSYTWQEFMKNPNMHMTRLHGDQDFIDRVIPKKDKRFFDENLVKSWRWQCFDGGYNTRTRKHHNPGKGTEIAQPTRIMVFHGNPKLHEINDPVVQSFWK